jgi:hypothetical protein
MRNAARRRLYAARPEPDRQFMLVKDHIAELRKDFYRTLSKVKVYVERNLGFEAEHHHRALHDVPGVEFYVVSAPPPTRRPLAARSWRY